MTTDVTVDSPVSTIVATGYSVNVSVLVLSPVSEVVSLGSVRSAATVTPTSPPSTIAAHGYLFDILATGIVSPPASTVTAHGFVKTTDAQVVVDSPIAYVRASGKVSSAAVVTGTIATVKTVSRDMQLPKVPNVDKQQRNWMDAVQAVINRRVLGIGNGTDRLVDLKDLLDAGVVGVGVGGNVTGVSPNVTKPPLVTGLSARGAMTTIILNWNAPSYSNFGLVEIWRSDNNNIGEAFRVGTSVTNFYQDAVGTGATKYYWVRSISTAGVAGDFAADGLKGQTSLDPSYVMQLLTSQQWSPNVAYQAYQYVRGIPASPDDAPYPFQNFQYVCIDGGISGTTEPTWPVVVGDTVTDGTITWQCRSLTEKVPFTIGLVDGVPSVVMSQAFIEDASIKTAQIHDLAADKITAGTLAVGNDIQVGSKLWGGFSEYANPGAVSGFWVGMDGGLPRLALDTGGPTLTRKYIRFNGETISMNVDIFSGADGYFDDLLGDSVSFNRANFDFLAFGEQVVSSQYVYDNDIPITEPEFLNYLCFPLGCQKTETWTSSTLVTGSGYSRPFAFFQTGNYSSIKPYDYRSADTRYRCSKDHIGFAILIDAPTFGNPVGNKYGSAYMDVYIFSESQSLPSNNYNDNSATSGIPSQYLLKMQLNSASDGVVTGYQNTGSGDVSAVDVDIYSNLATNSRQTLLTCGDDLGILGYAGSRTLKVAVVFKSFYQAGGSDDNTDTGIITVSFQMVSIPSSDDSIAINDETLAITATATTATRLLSLTAIEEAALRAIIRERLTYREPL